jgi:hypothetical protein
VHVAIDTATVRRLTGLYAFSSSFLT